MPPRYQYPSLSLQEIQQASQAITTVLSDLGLQSCLVGSAACSMYGMSRTPNDVDVVVLNLSASTSIEVLKTRVTSSNSRFFVTQTRNPWTILWYSLSPTPSRFGRKCKVDLLVPGLLDIPQLPSSRITYTAAMPDVPVMPLLGVILLKLRGWDDHRNDIYADKRLKQFVDVRDIDQLLDIAIEDGYHLRKEKWMPQSFQDKSRLRLQAYIAMHPETEERWKEIGLTRTRQWQRHQRVAGMPDDSRGPVHDRALSQAGREGNPKDMDGE